MATAQIATRPTSEIARDIRRQWNTQKGGVNYAAKPYLDAMLYLGNPSDNFGADSGKEVVLYFLCNASSFRGPEAKALKEELKKIYKIK